MTAEEVKNTLLGSVLEVYGYWGGAGRAGRDALSLPVGFALQQKGANLSLSLPRTMVIISSVF